MWTAADIPDQLGRTAVVTGANGGLGLETARELARRRAHVVMAARNPDKTEAAIASIRASVPEASLEVVALDLSSQASVQTAAEQILAAHPTLDLLVNNAGVMAIPEQRTVDGFEMQFGVCHLGHWSLTARLLPALMRTPGARVVTVTSTAHHMGRAVDVANPHLTDQVGEDHGEDARKAAREAAKDDPAPEGRTTRSSRQSNTAASGGKQTA